MFDSLGLTERALTIYRAILQQPRLLQKSQLADLASQVDLPEEEVTTQLNELREIGFIALRFNDTGKEYPLDPAIAFDRLVTRRQRAIDELTADLRADQLGASEFIADYNDFLVHRSTRDVEILDSYERAYQRMQNFWPTKIDVGHDPRLPNTRSS